jgi:ribosomal protein L37E
MPRRSRMKPNKGTRQPVKETFNEYIEKKTCSPECGKEHGIRTRAAAWAAKTSA